MCLLLAAAALATAGECPAEPVTTTFDAERIDYSFDHTLVTLTGGAHLLSRVADDPSRFVRIEAEVIEGDISRGRFEMLGDVRIETPRGTMEGASALYDVRTAHFSLRRGALMVPMTGDDQPTVCGFAYAQEITREGDIVYISKGRFTTCSRPHPHYSLEADRFRWDPKTHRVIVYGGSIKLYGLEIPVFPKIPYSFGGDERETPNLIPFPTYSSRDGLRLGWSFSVGNPADHPMTDVAVRWRQLRPLQISSRTLFDAGDSTFLQVNLGLREDVRQDIDRIVPLDRLPEVGIVDNRRLGSGYALDTTLSLGHFRQRGEDGLPGVTDDRARLRARLTSNWDGHLEPGETWWWIEGSEARYGDGGHYAALGAGLGGAARLTDWAAGNVELRRWITDGESPFVWDDVDLKTELHSNLQLRVTDDWRIRLGGNYDLDGGALEAWEAQLRHRAHCLTWKLSYSDTSDNFIIGAEVNGLFGHDEPADDACPADGPPDYWAAHAPQQPPRETAADDGPEQRTHVDQASEAMDTP